MVSFRQRRRNRQQEEEAESDGPEPGSLGKTPWAEAVRLDWPLYATPGDYVLEIRMGEATSRTDFTVDKPERFEPRFEPPMKIRGQKDDD